MHMETNLEETDSIVGSTDTTRSAEASASAAEAIDRAGASNADRVEERPRCPAPANFRAEIEAYDRAARVTQWNGPRYRMTVRTLGEGPPLIWIPGIASTYRGYAIVLNRLSERFRTIVYDYPGEHKNDGAQLSKIDHDDLVDDFFGLIDFLNLGRVFPVGISFGGTIALKALAREPRRFPKAATQGTFARRELAPAERLALAVCRHFPGKLANLPFRERVLRWNHGVEFPTPIADRWPLYIEQNGETPIASLAHRVDLVSRIDLRPILKNITVETLMIQGNEDRVNPRKYYDELIAATPSARGLVVPLVGHQTHYTHAELLARTIDEFFLPCAPGGCPNEPKNGDASTDDAS
jgi:pimeloyl-ACP methyl ester carboxylesterase